MISSTIKNRHPQQGQAATETLVSMLAIIPLFVVIPYIGKNLDVKFKVTESARVAALQRTIHSNGNWGIGESVRSDAELATSVNKWVLSQPDTANAGNDKSAILIKNSLWRGHDGKTLLDHKTVVGKVSETGIGLFRGPTTEGLLLGKNIGVLDLGEIADVPHLKKNRNGLVVAEFSLSTKSIPKMRHSGVKHIFSNTDLGQGPIQFSDRFAVISDTWIPGSEQNYANTLSSLVFDKTLSFMTAPGCYMWAWGGADISIFPDGRNCTNTELRSDTAVILDKHRDRANNRGKSK